MAMGIGAKPRRSGNARRTNFWYGNVAAAAAAGVQRLYRLAKEREKPDAQRESGYQERDMAFFRQGLQALDRRYDAAVDKAEWLLFLDGYLEQPAAERVAVLDEALGIAGASDIAQVEDVIDGYYAATTLDETADTRLGLMDASVAELEASDDPFMQLAVALYDYERKLESESEDARRIGASPAYMDAITQWQRSQGAATYRCQQHAARDLWQGAGRQSA